MALSSVQPIPCLQDMVSLSKESAYKLSPSDHTAIPSATAFQSTEGDVGMYSGVPSTLHSELPSMNSVSGEPGETRLNYHVLDRNQLGRTTVRNGQDRRVGTLHLKRTGGPTVNPSRMTASMMFTMTTVWTSLTTTMTGTLTAGTGVLPLHTTPWIVPSQ